MENDPTQIDRIQQYLRRITPQARRNLLVEIERMQIYGEDMPCSEIILAELRVEFRNSGESQNRVGNPSRHFFKPIEILFVDRAAELANSGQISRAPLDAFAAKYPHAIPFALTIVAKHLKTPWQLMRLATKMAPGKGAAQIASTPYAASVSVVLDHLDDK